MALEAPQGVADFMARSLLVHRRIVPPAEIVARIEAVTVDQARAAGAAMLAHTPARAEIGRCLMAEIPKWKFPSVTGELDEGVTQEVVSASFPFSFNHN